MKEAISNKNYYTENGILITAKGTSVTRKQLLMLKKKYDSTSKTEPSTASALQIESMQDEVIADEAMEKQISRIQNRYQTVNSQILTQASSLLVSIVFDSKQKPWYMYIKALANHTDWLYTHSIDVSLISLMIAMESGISKNILFDIGVGAVLHDVGKLLIPNRILQDATPLSETEELIIQQHCELGADCTSECSLPQISHDIILQHHERLDGTGYPNRLTAEQINEYAKIVMIADVFDTITAGSPYKETVCVEEALRVLENKVGAFDEKYVNVLKKIVAQM